MKDLLILYVKNPIPGKVKTRLAADIGTRNAVEVYRRLLKISKEALQGIKYDIWISFDSHIDTNNIWVDTDYKLIVQPEGDLGKKMENDFRRAFSKGYNRVCLLGSDIYDINSQIINTAFDKLISNDSVIGPSYDGGYYLIGFIEKAFHRSFFEDIEWSTNQVYGSTINKFQIKKISTVTLPFLHDIDTIEDLPHKWKSELL